MANPQDPPPVNQVPTTAAATPAAAPTSNEAPPASRNLLKIGSYLAGLGVAAEILGNVNKIQTGIVGLLGLRTSTDLYLVMTAIVAAMVVTGIATAAYWIFRNHEWTPRGRRAFVAIAVVVIMGASGLVYAFVPERPEATPFVVKQTSDWSEQLRGGFSAKTGGTLVSFQQPEGRTQAWTTAQALKAIFSAPAPLTRAGDGPRLWRALEYMHHAQVNNGQGWGYFEEWSTGVTEIAGWVAVAEIAALEPSHAPLWSPDERDKLITRATDALALLLATQQEDGGWGPTGDRPSNGPSRSRTYSTAMAAWALAEARHSETLRGILSSEHDEALRRAVRWLMNKYDSSLGWVPNPTRTGQNEKFLGLDAQIIYILARVQALPHLRGFVTGLPNITNAKTRFLATTEFTTRELDKNDRLHDTDRYLPPTAPETTTGEARTCVCPFTVEGSTFLWYPWSVAASAVLAKDDTLSPEQQESAKAVADELAGRLNESRGIINTGMHYVMAEYALGGSVYLNSR